MIQIIGLWVAPAAYFVGWFIGYRNGRTDERRAHNSPYDRRGEI